MTQATTRHKRAKNLLFGEPAPGTEDYPPEERWDDWYAQPAIGADIKTFGSDSTDSNPEPPEYLKRRVYRR